MVRALRGGLLAALLFGAGTGEALAADVKHGEQIFNTVCIGCHLLGVLGAPKAGDATAWGERLRQGLDTLVQHALIGFNKMPPKGGNPNLNESDLRAAIMFMAGEATVAEANRRDAGSGAAVATAVALAAPAAQRVLAPPPVPQKKADDSGLGERVVAQVCKGCHEIGVLGAPKIGNAKDWEPRLKQGEDTLLQHATAGIRNMPPKGGNPNLTADELRAAIRYMSQPAPPQRPKTAVAAPQPDAAVSPAPAVAAVQRTDANRFNRLMRPVTERNPPPPEDGIHDPQNDGTNVLQPPRTAFKSLPTSSGGNYVNWVKGLADKAIEPRWDLADPAKQPLIMDLNIVREVKGSMPNVVYPHKQHLEWLDCSNCHPAIFQPQKGANQISMAEILLGRKCGVCHGKVAFPVTECRRCHSMKKPEGGKP